MQRLIFREIRIFFLFLLEQMIFLMELVKNPNFYS